ncbi:hypothetical protein BJX96DRAFT_79445 [Aspergillus floccosus]
MEQALPLSPQYELHQIQSSFYSNFLLHAKNNHLNQHVSLRSCPERCHHQGFSRRRLRRYVKSLQRARTPPTMTDIDAPLSLRCVPRRQRKRQRWRLPHESSALPTGGFDITQAIALFTFLAPGMVWAALNRKS